MFLFILIFLIQPLHSQDIDYARTIIEKLSSPEFHGRGYSFKGDRISAGFIADEMEGLNINSFSSNYFQKFNISINTFPSDVEMIIDGKALFAGTDYVLHPASTSQKGSFEILAVNRHNAGTTEQLIKLTKLGMSSKFLIIDTTGIKDLKLREFLFFSQYQNYLEAAGYIRLVHNNLMFGKTDFEIKTTLLEIKKDAFPKDASNIKLLIKNKFNKNYTTQNVIGYVQGKKDSFIVYSAHYDHLGHLGETVYFPGANDNAGGVAMVLDLAKYYSNLKEKPEYSMVFLFLSAEEVGLLGSFYFVDNPLVPLDRIKCLINLDLVGTGSNGITVVNGRVHKELFNKMINVNEEKDYLKVIKSRGAAANSDHYPFHEKGVTSFFIYAQGADTHYHHVLDKAETLPLADYEDIVRFIIDFTKEIGTVTNLIDN